MQASNGLIFTVNKWRVWVSILFLLMCVCGISAFAYTQGLNPRILFVVVVAALFACSTLPVVIQYALLRGPAMSIDEEGISHAFYGKMVWSEIQYATVTKIERSEFLGIGLRDPATIKRPVQSIRDRMNSVLMGTRKKYRRIPLAFLTGPVSSINEYARECLSKETTRRIIDDADKFYRERGVPDAERTDMLERQRAFMAKWNLEGKGDQTEAQRTSEQRKVVAEMVANFEKFLHSSNETERILGMDGIGVLKDLDSSLAKMQSLETRIRKTNVPNKTARERCLELCVLGLFVIIGFCLLVGYFLFRSILEDRHGIANAFHHWLPLIVVLSLVVCTASLIAWRINRYLRKRYGHGV